MTHKALLLFLTLFSISQIASAQLAVASYDKAKHYQLKSMETGPWKFWPEGWYYSWWYKDIKFLGFKWRQKLPGLGIHDKGVAGTGFGGDKYVTRYNPNSTRRAIMLLQIRQTRKKYAATASSIEEISKRELVDAADRTVDIVYTDYKPLYDKLYLLLSKKIVEYRRVVGSDDRLLEFIAESEKIKEAVSYMSKHYVKNVDRQKAYALELKKLESLIVRCNNVIKVHYILQFQRIYSTLYA